MKPKTLAPDAYQTHLGAADLPPLVREVGPSPDSRLRKYGRHWAVYDATGELICVTVYRKGAREVLRRLHL